MERRNLPPDPALGTSFGHLLPQANEGWTVTPSDLNIVSRVLAATGYAGPRILIDATASDAVAARHAEWLAQGIHVVTACKLGQGTALQRWRAIQAACEDGRTRYGDSATVGAGLPLLHSLRALPSLLQGPGAGAGVTAAALLARTPKPTDAQIDTAMQGNICRCGTYQRIHRAIKRAAQV